MKRLLAYLFIVLGLGLTFNVNAEVEIKFKNCIHGTTSGPYEDFPYWNNFEVDLKKNKVVEINGSLSTNLERVYDYTIEHEIEVNNSNKLITKKKQDSVYKQSYLEFNKKKNTVTEIRKTYVNGTDKRQINGEWKYFDYEVYSDVSYLHCSNITGSWKNKKTQIAKAEPSQTQKVTSNKDYYCLVYETNRSESFYFFNINNFASFQKKTSHINKFKNIDPNNLNTIKKLCDLEIFRDKNPIKYKIITLHYDGLDVYEIIRNPTGTYIGALYGRAIKENYILNYWFVKDILDGSEEFLNAKLDDYVNKTQIAEKETKQKDENLYNWYAIAKHPKTNFEFIATKVSNKEDAKKIAIKKCYNFVTNQLDKKGYNDCFIDLIIDKRDNLQLAEDITLKQQDKITFFI